MNISGGANLVLVWVTVLYVSCAGQHNDKNAPSTYGQINKASAISTNGDGVEEDVTSLTRRKANAYEEAASDTPGNLTGTHLADRIKPKSKKSRSTENPRRIKRSATFGFGYESATSATDYGGVDKPSFLTDKLESKAGLQKLTAERLGAAKNEEDEFKSTLTKRPERNAEVWTSWWSNGYGTAPLRGYITGNGAESYGSKRGAGKPFDGFLGMRGRKWSNDEGKKRIPDGFLGMRGKKWQPSEDRSSSNTLSWNHELEPVESRQIFE